MDFRYLRVCLDKAPVAYLYLQRPELHNAFDDTMIAELTQALDYLATQSELRVLVLAADGRSFCAGADLNWMQRMVDYSLDENRQDASAMALMYHKLAHFPLPTIAMVQGSAFGGGVGLVVACDLVIASDNVQFCLSEVKLGIIPAVICPYLIKTLGMHSTKRYALTAEAFTAAEAKRLGLVHHVVAREDLATQTHALCQQLLQNGPEALKAIKQLIWQITDLHDESPINQASIEAIAQIRVSSEGQQGLRTFLAKEKAPWLKPPSH